MSQNHLVKLKSTKSKTVIYTFKNKKQNPDKLEMKKFDKAVGKHVPFKETKK